MSPTTAGPAERALRREMTLTDLAGARAVRRRVAARAGRDRRTALHLRTLRG